MSFSAEFFKPNGDHAPVFERLIFTPAWYSATALGGYESADIRVDGPSEALQSLLQLLGYTVHIRNENHSIVWSGVVDEALIAYGAMEVGLSTRNLANRVRVAYTSQTNDGTLERLTTDWAEDSESIARYGYAEQQFTRSDISAEQADAYRDTLLNTLKNPTPLIRTARGASLPSATLSCTGQWALLGRQLYSNVAGLVEYNTSGGSDQLMGCGKTSTQFGFAGNKILDFSQDVDALPAGASVVISGSTSNDGTVATTRPGQDGDVYTATTISFDPSDDILDSANGLAFFADNDMVDVSGSIAQDEIRIVTDAINAGHITVGGTAITAEAAGPSITLTQAGYVETDASFTNELPSASITLRVVGVQVAQKFTLAADVTWTVNDIAIRVKKVGSPVDNLTVALYTDSSGSPGSSIESAVIDGSEIGTAMAWHRFTFANTNSIAYGTNYWIVVSRSGANSMDNFYVVDVNEELGYTGGNLKLYNGSSWVARDPDADMPFIVRGAEVTTTQIDDIVDNAAQFLTTLDLQTASGIESHQYRAGDGTALFEIEQLIESGTSAGARLLARVMPEKILTIYTQPTSSRLTDLRLLSDGTIAQPTGRPLESGVLPAGQWVRLQGINPNTDHLATLSKFFIERAEFNTATGEWILEPPGFDSVWDMGVNLS